jgi:hypothetical protein
VDVQFESAGEAKCQTYIVAGTHLKMLAGSFDFVVRNGEDGRWLFRRIVNRHCLSPGQIDWSFVVK